MTVTLELTDDQAQELAVHLTKSRDAFKEMKRDARDAGDHHAAEDYFAKVCTASELKGMVRSAMLTNGIEDPTVTDE